MEEKIFVGYGYGRFQNDSGIMQEYCNVFVLEPFKGPEGNDYHFGGQKAVKYKCVSPKVWEGVKPGDTVQCYFDSSKRVSYMVSVKA